MLAACARSQEAASQSPSSSRPPAAAPAAGFRSLQTLSAWRGYKSQEIPKGWSVVDGVITKEGNAEDLVSRDQYGNFEFSLDWKLAPGGNAGIFYRATEEYDHIYWSGTEYQLLDDARHPDGRTALTRAGSAYGLYAPPEGVVKPAGQWNSTRIVARGAHVEHWLNGRKVVEYDYGSPDWEAKVKASKFADWPHYGRATRGYIGIQGDHQGLLSLRNMQIRELP
jgi:hypothetical protein